MSKLFIYGAGGHAKVVFDIAQLCGYTDIQFVVDFPPVKCTLMGMVVDDRLPVGYTGDFIVAIGDNFSREAAYKAFSRANPRAKFATLKHPSAFISGFAQIGNGVVVMPGAVVNACTVVEQGGIINTNSSVDHDCHIGEFASLAPRVALGGNVLIGSRSFIGIGAIIRNGVSVGDDTVIGAGSLLLSDFASNLLVYGTPAQSIRHRTSSERYF